jgi:hypothetical protein
MGFKRDSRDMRNDISSGAQKKQVIPERITEDWINRRTIGEGRFCSGFAVGFEV